jgi:hypothetical protein
LRRLQELTVRARRGVRDQTPTPSARLRAQLAELVQNQRLADGEGLPSKIAARWRIGLPRLAAAIVLLAIGAWIGHFVGRSGTSVSRTAVDTTSAPVIPASVISQAQEIHSYCSRLAEGLHNAGYPQDVAPLAADVERDLHSEHPYPDFGPIGYRYRGAGPCGKPMPRTAHLLYRSVRPGSYKAISVFVQPWNDQYPLAEGRLYTVSVATSPFPMLAWRTESIVYFLVADDAETERKAIALIQGASTTEPAR